MLLPVARLDDPVELATEPTGATAVAMTRKSGKPAAHQNRATAAGAITDPDTLATLAKDTSKAVRRTLASNPHTPDETVEKLHTWARRQEDTDTLVHTLPRVPPALALGEVLAGRPEVAWAAARRVATSGEHFAEAWELARRRRHLLVQAAECEELHEPCYVELLQAEDEDARHQILSASEQAQRQAFFAYDTPWNAPMSARKARALVKWVPETPTSWPLTPAMGPGVRAKSRVLSRQPHEVSDILMTSGVPGYQIAALRVVPHDADPPTPQPPADLLDRAIEAADPAVLDEVARYGRHLSTDQWERLARRLTPEMSAVGLVEGGNGVLGMSREQMAKLSGAARVTLITALQPGTLELFLAEDTDEPGGSIVADAVTSDDWREIVDRLATATDGTAHLWELTHRIVTGKRKRNLPAALVRHLVPSKALDNPTTAATIAQILDDEVGDNLEVWREVVTQLPEWDGSLEQLIAAAYACVPDAVPPSARHTPREDEGADDGTPDGVPADQASSPATPHPGADTDTPPGEDAPTKEEPGSSTSPATRPANTPVVTPLPL